MKNSEVTEEERNMLRSKIGQLLWVARQTRPDIMFDTNKLSVGLKCAKVSDLIDANKVIRRIMTERVQLKFRCLGGKELKMVLFTDASLGNAQDNGSQGGLIAFIANANDDCAPVLWSSKKLRRIVRSTLAAETLALVDGIDFGIFIATLFSELYYGIPDPKKMPITCYIDCQSLYDTLESTKGVSEKRLRLDISSIKENIQTGLITVKWVDSNNQLANCLTKLGASALKLLSVRKKGNLRC